MYALSSLRSVCALTKRCAYSVRFAQSEEGDDEQDPAVSGEAAGVTSSFVAMYVPTSNAIGGASLVPVPCEPDQLERVSAVITALGQILQPQAFLLYEPTYVPHALYRVSPL